MSPTPPWPRCVGCGVLLGPDDGWLTIGQDAARQYTDTYRCDDCFLAKITEGKTTDGKGVE